MGDLYQLNRCPWTFLGEPGKELRTAVGMYPARQGKENHVTLLLCGKCCIWVYYFWLRVFREVCERRSSWGTVGENVDKEVPGQCRRPTLCHSLFNTFISPTNCFKEEEEITTQRNQVTCPRIWTWIHVIPEPFPLHCDASLCWNHGKWERFWIELGNSWYPANCSKNLEYALFGGIWEEK